MSSPKRLISQRRVPGTRTIRPLCSPKKVAKYAAAFRPTCNDGLGCAACWEKYHDIHKGETAWLPTYLFQKGALKKLLAALERMKAVPHQGRSAKLSAFYDDNGYLNIRFEARVRGKEGK